VQAGGPHGVGAAGQDMAARAWPTAPSRGTGQARGAADRSLGLRLSQAISPGAGVHLAGPVGRCSRGWRAALLWWHRVGRDGAWGPRGQPDWSGQ